MLNAYQKSISDFLYHLCWLPFILQDLSCVRSLTFVFYDGQKLFCGLYFETKLRTQKLWTWDILKPWKFRIFYRSTVLDHFQFSKLNMKDFTIHILLKILQRLPNNFHLWKIFLFMHKKFNIWMTAFEVSNKTPNNKTSGYNMLTSANLSTLRKNSVEHENF